MSETTPLQNLWLMRSQDLKISGPFTLEEIRKKLDHAEVLPSDELCPSTGYWFMASDAQEMIRWIGKSLPRRGRASDEITETQTEPQMSAEGASVSSVTLPLQSSLDQSPVLSSTGRLSDGQDGTDLSARSHGWLWFLVALGLVTLTVLKLWPHID